MTLCAIIQMYIEKLLDCLFFKKYKESLLKMEQPSMEYYMIYEEKIQV